MQTTIRKALDRADYSRMGNQELRSRLASTRDRMGRADTVATYLADHFAAQEIVAVLLARGVSIDTGK